MGRKIEGIHRSNYTQGNYKKLLEDFLENMKRPDLREDQVRDQSKRFIEVLKKMDSKGFSGIYYGNEQERELAKRILK
jgi:hypothetical protein